MARRIVIAALAAATAAALIAPAAAQFGGFFGNDPPRPPGNVPSREPIDRDSQFRTTNFPPVVAAPPPGNALPPPGSAVPPPSGAIQSAPLAPPPGAAVTPPATGTGPALAATPPADGPLGGAAPAGGAAPPGAPGAPGAGDPATATAAVPPREEIIEPPTAKIANPSAVFAGLDKITGRIISFDVKMGETVQFGALQVTPRACYTRPPTENANTDGFVEVEEVTLEGKVKRVFSGWMFASSPGLHAVEHPIYDVWLTDCKGGAPTVTAEAPSEPAAPAAAPAPVRNQRPAPPRRNPPPPAPPR